ncbi:RICIN domain-containing protein [Bifidobacterium goeldii]|nr:RICIN domain-containing protein [Bifidobacterium goeldii]
MISEQQLDDLAAANKDAIAEGEYTISSAINTNFVLDVSGGSHANGANVQIYQDNASSAQRWRVVKDTIGYLTLINVGSGKVLDVSAGSSAPGANVDQWESNGTRAQKWIALSENGHIVLRSAIAGDHPLALDVYKGWTRNGVNVQSYTVNGASAQQWNFEKIADMSDQVRSYWSKHSTLGRPTAPAQDTPSGSKQTFQRGVTYQHGDTVIGISGAIYTKWISLGGENGKLGAPTSDVRTLRNGFSQSFKGGQQIHWSAATGAHVTAYGIQNYWKLNGWETGRLGYPTSDEIRSPRDGGASQHFQGGYVYWSPQTGAQTVAEGILGAYIAQGYEVGPLGYPVNEEHDWNKGRAQDFQHGTLTWAGCGKKGWQNPAQYFQVSSCDVGVPANGMFGYASPSRISMSATREQAIEAMISRAYDYLGTRYVWDYALQPGVGVDCAGLVMQSLYAAGMDLHEYNPTNHWYDPWHSHDANNMAADSRFKHVSLNERQRGDLIYWPGHIAIYLGNDQIIEANVPAVRINSLWAYGTPGGALRPFV